MSKLSKGKSSKKRPAKEIVVSDAKAEKMTKQGSKGIPFKSKKTKGTSRGY